MDLKQYFKKIRDVESALTDTYPVIVSLETSDGGRPGVVSEVSRATAAQLIVEGKAVLASDEQKQSFLERMVALKEKAEKLELAKRVQVAIIADSDLQASMINQKSPTSGSGR